MDVSTIGLIEDEDILLDLASLALSHLDHDNADIAPYLAKLEEIEDRVCDEGRSAFLPRERAAVLSRVLHGELGFVGDADDYDAPANADFIRVLDRRRGLPIALSILYVAMARRGWMERVCAQSAGPCAGSDRREESRGDRSSQAAAWCQNGRLPRSAELALARKATLPR